MMAIFCGHLSSFILLDGEAAILTGGTYLFSSLISRSAINFLTASIETALSIVPLVHASSQRLLQTLPQIAGNGLSFLIKAKASSYLPSAAFFK